MGTPANSMIKLRNVAFKPYWKTYSASKIEAQFASIYRTAAAPKDVAYVVAMLCEGDNYVPK